MLSAAMEDVSLQIHVSMRRPEAFAGELSELKSTFNEYLHFPNGNWFHLIETRPKNGNWFHLIETRPKNEVVDISKSVKYS